MPAPAFIDILRCPETRQKLTVATPSLLGTLRSEQVAGKLFNRAGTMVSAPVESGLVREDGRVFYPVCGGIPVLVTDEAIDLKIE